MTDRQKLSVVFHAFNVDTLATPKCITGGGRRFFFDSEDAVEKIIDYVDGITYLENTVGRRGYNQ